MSQKSKLRKRNAVDGGHDDVVKHLHVDQLQRGLQFARQDLIGAARLRDARRVLGCIRVCQHDWPPEKRYLH